MSTIGLGRAHHAEQRDHCDGSRDEPPAEARAWAHYQGRMLPAAPVARGAAYELFAQAADDGFLPNPRPGGRWRYRRFVPATEVMLAEQIVPGEPPEPFDTPLVAPVSRGLSWEVLHRLSQTPPARYTAGEADLIGAVRRSVRIRRGTPMLKVLTARQVAGLLYGWSVTGFCHRQYDVAHLRTPVELSPINGTGCDGDVVFALRWRAVDPLDYAAPLHARLCPAGVGETDASGLTAMVPQDRVGPQVLGTGFAPTSRQLVPEWIIADVADLPLPVGASIVAYTDDGTEVVLYTFLPEQSAWLRMSGPQWRGILEQVPTEGPAGQEYFPVPPPASRLVGTYQGQPCDVIADPPVEFRVASKTRTTRYPVDSAARRVRYACWRGVPATMVRGEGPWRLLRLCAPDPDSVQLLGATCVERGVYEVWAPANEITDDREIDLHYDLSG